MSDKPRVLMVGWELPPHNSGGLGVACAGLAQALADDQIDLMFTLPYLADGENVAIQIIDCHHPAWDKAVAQPPFTAYHSGQGKRQSGKLLAPTSQLEHRVDEYAQQVLKFARAHRDEFDLVHAHDWMSFPAAMKIKTELHKPFIAHVHSTEHDRSLTDDFNTYIGSCEEVGMQLADQVITVSYYTKRLLVEKYLIDPNKIDVVHNGVVPLLQDLNNIPREFAYDRPVIVFMGRLTVQKGPDYFLKLAEKVVSERPDALFIVAGMGDMYQQLLFTNAGKNLSANVLFSGFVRGGAHRKILDRADVFVMPSVSEPFGLVAAEAAQRGTPVIASKNSGVVEVMKGSPKIDFWDIDAMAAEVFHLLDDEDYRRQVVRTQAQQLKQTTWKKAAKKVEKIYQQLGQRKKLDA